MVGSWTLVGWGPTEMGVGCDRVAGDQLVIDQLIGHILAEFDLELTYPTNIPGRAPTGAEPENPASSVTV